MKYHTNMSKKTSQFDYQEKIYGTVVVGARGQVVIPADARKSLSIKPGDRLLVMSKFNKALGFIKAEDLEGLIKMAMKEVTDPVLKAKIKKGSKNLRNFVK